MSIMKKMKKRYLVISIILILALISIAFLYYTLAVPKYPNSTNHTNIVPIIDENTVLSEAHINYVLTEMEFYNLHNIPLSSETPKINLKIDDDWYSSEVKEGKITTKIGEITNPDLIIYTSSKEILDSIISTKTNEYMKESVSNGNTKIELNSGYTELFSKGYLSLYKELTGKSLTGSMVKIFSQG